MVTVITPQAVKVPLTSVSVEVRRRWSLSRRPTIVDCARMSIAASSNNHSQRAGTTPADRGPGLLILLGVGTCFALSGFAALLYQTAWMRQFSLVFGTSELAVATVLAAYMGGLALGARVIEHYLDRVRRPVLTYGVLEFAIACSAIAVPLLLLASQSAMQAAIGQQPDPPDAKGWGQGIFYISTAFVVLVIPTALMGATLPLLTRHVVHRESQIASRTGLLYSINTFGAVAGALVAAFLLLPALGLQGTVYVGAVVNVVVFGIAALLAVREWPTEDDRFFVLMGTRRGVVKKTGPQGLQQPARWRHHRHGGRGRGDSVIGVTLTDGSN
ncbi:MAG: fused MFS/spermidine synthase, partial [Gammaproteobacteria bacterium]|nr:fused MFS/spermidine synthase [Gammaproteobacteria bacterium]